MLRDDMIYLSRVKFNNGLKYIEIETNCNIESAGNNDYVLNQNDGILISSYLPVQVITTGKSILMA